MKKQAARQQEEELQRKRAQRYAEYVSASHSWAAASPRLPTPPSSEQTLSRQREEESRRAWSMTDGQAFALGRGLGNSAARSILDTSNDGFSARHEAPGEALTASLLARDAANEIARDADEAPIVVKDEAAGIDVAYDPGGGAPDVDLKQVKESMGSGTPLDAGTREYMEWRFGLNLGNVRIHTGPKADALSKALMAHAFALGADVNFAAGQYKPGTKQGDFLLAHELTHVVQAGHATEQPAAKTTELGARKSSSVSEPDDAIEVEADQVAGEVVSVGRSEFAKAKREGSVGASASVESAHAPSPTARKAARLPAAGGGAGAARKIARDGGNTPDEEGDEEQESVPDPDVQSEGEVELEPGEGPPPVDTTLPDQSIEPSDGNIAPGSPSGATFGPGPAPVSGTPAPVSAPTQNVTPANDATINGGLGSTQGTSIPAAEQLFTAAVGAEPNQHQAQIEAGIAQIGTALSATQAQVRSSAASLGASLLSEADAHIGAVQTAAASAAALISSAYADARTATSAAAEAARGQVDVYTASAKGEIEAAGADAITRAQTALSESATAFAAEVETSIAAAESEATTTVAAMRKAGRDAAADALKVAEEWAVKYEGRTGATDLDKKRAKARADAARSVGQNTADELIKKGNAAADEFSGLHANIRPTIETLLQPVLDTLGQQSGDIAQTVASTTASLMEQVDEAGAPVVQSINEAEAAALTSLEAQEASMLRLAAESATAVQDQLRTAAEAGRASLEAAGEELAESLAAEAAALQSQLAGQDAPASEDLSLEIDALIETILNSDAADALHDLYRQLSANLSDLANQGVQSIDQLVSSAMELAARFVDQFSGGLQQSLESLSNTLGEFVSGALGQFEELVNQVMAAAEAVIREARTQIGGKVDGMLGDLRQAASGLAEVLSEALGGLPAQIKEQADEAASKIKSGFWGRLGAVLLVIVIVVALVALVIFAGPALLAALGVAAGTLLAKVLIGVAIGFIAAAAFAMFKDAFGGTFSITNWRNYLKSGIVGAIVGAVTVLTGGMSVWAQGALMGVADYFTNLTFDQLDFFDGVGQGFFKDFSFLDLGITVVLSMGLNRLFKGADGKSGLGGRIKTFFKGKMPSWNSFQTMVGQHINPTLRSVGLKALNSTWISVLRNMPSTLTTKWLKSTVKDIAKAGGTWIVDTFQGFFGPEAQPPADANAAPVQNKPGSGGGTADVHAAAAEGTSGSGGPLPFGSAIQKSFGKHDISMIKAYTGPSAADAGKQIGAAAFASGSDVAFARTPDLHTAAHEAAHVVQQAHGVSLLGGVGKAGDQYETHADSVADAVVAGRSAEPLLDAFTGGVSSKTHGVQSKAVQLEGDDEEREPESDELNADTSIAKTKDEGDNQASGNNAPPVQPGPNPDMSENSPELPGPGPGELLTVDPTAIETPIAIPSDLSSPQGPRPSDVALDGAGPGQSDAAGAAGDLLGSAWNFTANCFGPLVGYNSDRGGFAFDNLWGVGAGIDKIMDTANKDRGEGALATTIEVLDTLRAISETVLSVSSAIGMTCGILSLIGLFPPLAPVGAALASIAGICGTISFWAGIAATAFSLITSVLSAIQLVQAVRDGSPNVAEKYAQYQQDVGGFVANGIGVLMVVGIKKLTSGMNRANGYGDGMKGYNNALNASNGNAARGAAYQGLKSIGEAGAGTGITMSTAGTTRAMLQTTLQSNLLRGGLEGIARTSASRVAISAVKGRINEGAAADADAIRAAGASSSASSGLTPNAPVADQIHALVSALPNQPAPPPVPAPVHSPTELTELGQRRHEIAAARAHIDAQRIEGQTTIDAGQELQTAAGQHEEAAVSLDEQVVSHQSGLSEMHTQAVDGIAEAIKGEQEVGNLGSETDSLAKDGEAKNKEAGATEMPKPKKSTSWFDRVANWFQEKVFSKVGAAMDAVREFVGDIILKVVGFFMGVDDIGAKIAEVKAQMEASKATTEGTQGATQQTSQQAAQAHADAAQANADAQTALSQGAAVVSEADSMDAQLQSLDRSLASEEQEVQQSTEQWQSQHGDQVDEAFTGGPEVMGEIISGLESAADSTLTGVDRLEDNAATSASVASAAILSDASQTGIELGPVAQAIESDYTALTGRMDTRRGTLASLAAEATGLSGQRYAIVHEQLVRIGGDIYGVAAEAQQDADGFQLLIDEALTEAALLLAAAAQAQEEAQQSLQFKEAAAPVHAPASAPVQLAPAADPAKELKKDQKDVFKRLQRVVGKDPNKAPKRRVWNLIKEVLSNWANHLQAEVKPEPKWVREAASLIQKVTQDPLRPWFDYAASTGKIREKDLKRAGKLLKSPKFVGGAQEAEDKGVQKQVQRAGGGAGSEGVHAAAAAGTKGSGGALPHSAAIQKSFGRHNVGNIRAHTGSAADGAAKAMGARAYASGSDVAFAKGGADLHTAAHEAAHVVQQRSGVSLSGGVGKAGDKYERHADAAADAVVAGKSAEPILNQMSGGGGKGGVQKSEGVQLKADGAFGGRASYDLTVSSQPRDPVQMDRRGALIGGLLGGVGGAIIGDMVGDAINEYQEAQRIAQEIADFQAESFADLENHQPSSGGMFDVSFDAAALCLSVVLKVGFDFQNGDPAEVSPGFRPEEFQWTPEETAEWQTDFMSSVSATWSEQHTFKSTKDGWDAVEVTCSVAVVQDDAAPHFILTVNKYPDDAGMVTSSICGPGTHHGAGNSCPANADDGSGVPIEGSAEFDSNDMRTENKLDWTEDVVDVPFAEGETALDGAGKTALDPAKTTLAGDTTRNATLTGHASSTHPTGMSAEDGAIHNMDLARARNASVQSELTGSGVQAGQLTIRNKGEDGAGAGVEWCKVAVRVGDEASQDVAVHETGHMLGLGDEYGTEGDPVRSTYDTLLQTQAGQTITRGSTDSIMSMGSTVESWHYSTFLEALKAITGSDDWSL